MLKVSKETIFRILALICLVVFAYYFSNIVMYVFLSYILALICKPLAVKLSTVKIYKWKISYGLSSMLSIFIFLLVFAFSMLFFVPSLVAEIGMLGNINYDTLSSSLNVFLANIQDFLYENAIMDRDTTLVGLITDEIKNVVNLNSLSLLIGNVVSFTGSFFFGLFSVVFVTFFFLKDDIKLDSIARIFVSDEQVHRVTYVSNKVNNLLSRYFIGSLVRIIIMIILLYIGFIIFGVKGALLQAFMGGVLNIIPYLGPVIGVVISSLFGIIDCLSVEMYTEIMPITLKIIGVYVVANVVDNVVLQPMIFSQSVKAHPIEIFLVTIMGGDVAGMTGMILAIPVYTILRVAVIEIYKYVQESKKVVT